jgi:hypothetical protein
VLRYWGRKPAASCVDGRSGGAHRHTFSKLATERISIRSNKRTKRTSTGSFLNRGRDTRFRQNASAEHRILFAFQGP